jgi:CDP-diacylglycerol--glycerol-3-phosphate 3-phosphatidyltransferase
MGGCGHTGIDNYVTIYDLKPAFQNLLRPVCRALATAGITANQVTIAALLGSFVVGGLFALRPNVPWVALLIPVWLFLRMALNAIDGMLAREHKMQSELGGFLNELSDVAADAALYLPFALVTGVSAGLIIAIVILSILTEMAGVVAVQVGASRRYDGPMGKSDRAFVFGLLGLLLGLGVDPGWWLNGVLGVVVVLTAFTIINRVRKGLDELG